MATNSWQVSSSTHTDGQELCLARDVGLHDMGAKSFAAVPSTWKLRTRQVHQRQHGVFVRENAILWRVLLLTDECFVHLDHLTTAANGGRREPSRMASRIRCAMTPRRLVLHVQVVADALLARTEQVNSPHTLVKRDVAVLKQGTDSHGELTLAGARTASVPREPSCREPPRSNPSRRSAGRQGRWARV